MNKFYVLKRNIIIFLKKNDKFYKILSGLKFEKFGNCKKDGYIYGYFNEFYIQNINFITKIILNTVNKMNRKFIIYIIEKTNDKKNKI